MPPTHTGPFSVGSPRAGRWLPAVTTPTLVLHAAGDPVVPVAGGRYPADHIDGARLVEFPGTYHASWDPVDVAALRDTIIGFLSRVVRPPIR